MSIDLSNYSAIGCAVLVRIVVNQYKATPEATPAQEILRFSDSQFPITILYNNEPETYIGVGRLLNVSPSRSELRNSSSEVSLSLSGIPNTSIAEILNSKIKGSRIEVWRVIVDPATGIPLDIPGNPAGRFFGMVTNYTLEESWGSTVSSNTINLVCTSHLSWLASRIQGRRTNPFDENLFFPGDKSFDRVPSLIGVSYNFGAPPPA